MKKQFVFIIIASIFLIGLVGADIMKINLDSKSKINEDNAIALDVALDYPNSVNSTTVKILTNQTINVTKRIASYHPNGSYYFKNIIIQQPIYDEVISYKIDYNKLTIELQQKIKVLEQEDIALQSQLDLLKMEICNKDKSYSFCETGGGIIITP